MARGRRGGERRKEVDDSEDDTVTWGEDEPWDKVDNREQPDVDPLGGREG
jgi:hypothetical protein